MKTLRNQRVIYDTLTSIINDSLEPKGYAYISIIYDLLGTA